jgi:hypothetical protein
LETQRHREHGEKNKRRKNKRKKNKRRERKARRGHGEKRRHASNVGCRALFLSLLYAYEPARVGLSACSLLPNPDPFAQAMQNHSM